MSKELHEDALVGILLANDVDLNEDGEALLQALLKYVLRVERETAIDVTDNCIRFVSRHSRTASVHLRKRIRNDGSVKGAVTRITDGAIKSD